VAPESEAYALAERTLREQYVLESSSEEPSSEKQESSPGQEVSPEGGFSPEGELGDGFEGGFGKEASGSDSEVWPRPAEELSAEDLQSPYDPEATYRRKNGEEYPRGYVVGVSETCDPSNEVQLITAVEVAPNTTDDGELLKRSLQEQAQRNLAPKQMTTDGGFTGSTAEEACEANGVELRSTRVRGGRSDPDRLG